MKRARAPLRLSASPSPSPNVNSAANVQSKSPRPPSSPPIAVPRKAPKITVDTNQEADDDDDDDVFFGASPSPYRSPGLCRRVRAFSPSVCCAVSPNDSLAVDVTDENGLLQRTLPADLHVLGRGGFGKVVLGLWKGKRVAVKILPHDENHCAAESVSGERNAADLAHENVVRLHAVFDNVAGSSASSSVLVLDYAGKSNLQTIIRRHPEVMEREEFQIRCFTDVISGLEYIHSRGVVHLDLKPANVMVASGGTCKIGDFGSSERLGSDERTAQTTNATKMVGTSGYQAPEYLRDRLVSGKCDIYAFGVLVWHVVTGETPFAGEHPHTVIFKVVSQQMRPRAALSPADGRFKFLYETCWRQLPVERPDAREVLASLAKTHLRPQAPSTPKQKKSRSSSIRL